MSAVTTLVRHCVRTIGEGIFAVGALITFHPNMVCHVARSNEIGVVIKREDQAEYALRGRFSKIFLTYLCFPNALKRI